jgi:hypothetical protein
MKTSLKILHWLPRIICIMVILFISMFALDVFNPALSIWQQVAGFLIHLIPSFILLALLAVAWKWELIGGILFSVIGLGFTPFLFNQNYTNNNSIWISIGNVMMITFPIIVVGVLFIISHFSKKRHGHRIDSNRLIHIR